MTSRSFGPYPIGKTLVRLLHMRKPEDPGHQRTQASFATLQLASGVAALAQALIILGSEGWHLAPTQFRIALNAGLALAMFAALTGLTARGKLTAAATAIGVSILAYDVAFAYGFSLLSTPTPSIVTLSLLGALALVEPPRRIGWWAAIIGVVLGFGMVVTPVWSFTPSATSLMSVMLFTVAFFGMVLIEFRQSMHEVIVALQDQTRALSVANLELQASIAERDSLSEKLVTAERLEAMGSMAGNIAHDFNNMLTVIRGYSDRISAETTTSSPHREEVDQLVRAVTRASNVSQDVLDFANPIAFAFVPVDVTQFMRALKPKCERILGTRARLDMTVPDSLGYVSADAAQLERVFLNLVTNARDATPIGGSVHLHVTGTDERVLCRVIDEGGGVPESQRERIFEPFYTTKGTTGGGGLGLASSYAIIRQHFGYITVRDAAGGGAEFTVDLPRAAATAGPHRPMPFDQPVPLESGKSLDGITVLLVEDDEPLRRLILRMLQRAGATVFALDNGIAAVNQLQDARLSAHAPFDVVITDLRLPEGSGGDVINAALALAGNIAIVAVSGFLEDPVVAALAAQNKLQFLSKPFSEPQLLEAVTAARRYADRRD